MISKIKNILFQIVAGANLTTVIIMLVLGYSDRLHPTTLPVLANAGLVFPIFIIINLTFLAFWVIFRFRFILISLLGFIACFMPVRNYCPLNVPGTMPDSTFKVLSYNVWMYASSEYPGYDNPILQYIAGQEADIACLQEAAPSAIGQKTIEKTIYPVYQYRDTLMKGNSGTVLAFFSKHPIIKKQRIDFESTGNMAGAVWLDVDGDTIIVVNVHFETTSLTDSDKAHFKQMVKGDYASDSVETTSRQLYGKLKESTFRRAPQAEAVAQFIEQHIDQTIICCGDFNDCPNSYAHYTISKKLTDCYVATGNGPGISYHKGGFYVRIDNIFCSADLEPARCLVDNKIAASDHYPIVCWLKKEGKP